MYKPIKHLAVAAASIVAAAGSPVAQTIDIVVDGAIYAIEPYRSRIGKLCINAAYPPRGVPQSAPVMD